MQLNPVDRQADAAREILDDERIGRGKALAVGRDERQHGLRAAADHERNQRDTPDAEALEQSDDLPFSQQAHREVFRAGRDDRHAARGKGRCDQRVG